MYKTPPHPAIVVSAWYMFCLPFSKVKFKANKYITLPFRKVKLKANKYVTFPKTKTGRPGEGQRVLELSSLAVVLSVPVGKVSSRWALRLLGSITTSGVLGHLLAFPPLPSTCPHRPAASWASPADAASSQEWSTISFQGTVYDGICVRGREERGSSLGKNGDIVPSD